MDSSDDLGKKLLTIGEAAKYLDVSIDTLRRWEVRGRIKPFRSPGGHRYYAMEDLDSLFNKKYQRDEFSKKTIDESSLIETDSKINSDSLGTTPQYVEALYGEEKTEVPSKSLDLEETQPTTISSEEEVKEEARHAYSEPQNQAAKSILEPIESQTQTTAPFPPTAMPDYSQSQKLQDILGEKKEKRITKTEAVLIAGVIIFTIADVILFLSWFSSTKIITPIP